MKSRLMQQHDVAQVIAIEQSANHYPWSQQNVEDCLKSGYHACVFYDQADEILGFFIVQQVVDEAHLLNICVKLRVQGQGLGREILDQIIDYATEISAALIVLEVRRSNHRAQQLYLQAGFNEMSVRTDYYPSENGREDAILMGLDLVPTSFFKVN